MRRLTRIGLLADRYYTFTITGGIIVKSRPMVERFAERLQGSDPDQSVRWRCRLVPRQYSRLLHRCCLLLVPGQALLQSFHRCLQRWNGDDAEDPKLWMVERALC